MSFPYVCCLQIKAVPPGKIPGVSSCVTLPKSDNLRQKTGRCLRDGRWLGQFMAKRFSSQARVVALVINRILFQPVAHIT